MGPLQFLGVFLFFRGIFMSIDFSISHNEKTMIKNLYEGSIKLYDTRQEVKEGIHNIIGTSNITGMVRVKSEKDEQVSKEVKFITETGSIKCEDEATTKYIDIMSELNNRRIEKTCDIIENLIESGNFSVIKLIVDGYNREETDSSYTIDDDIVVYHLTKGRHNAIDAREVKNMSEIIDKFIEKYGISSMQEQDNHSVILGNDNKKLISNKETIKMMINRKVGNYGKRI